MLTTIIYHGDMRTISALLIIAQALFGESRQPLCELVEPAVVGEGTPGEVLDSFVSEDSPEVRLLF